MSVVNSTPATQAWWLAGNAWQPLTWQQLQSALPKAQVGQLIAYGAPVPSVYQVVAPGGQLQLAPSSVQQSALGNSGYAQQQQVVGVDVTGDGVSDFSALLTTGGGAGLVRECHMKLTNAPGGWHCQQLPNPA